MNVKKTGGIRWQPIAYFSDPHNALKHMINIEVMGTGLKDLETVCKKLDELSRLVDGLKGMPEMLQRCTRREKDAAGGN